MSVMIRLLVLRTTTSTMPMDYGLWYVLLLVTSEVTSLEPKKSPTLNPPRKNPLYEY